MKKTIQQGAEAIIYLNNNQIEKHRIKKTYRLPILDTKLRKSRTKAEAKIIQKLKNIISVPEIIETNDKDKIIMQYIKGKKLSQHLENLGWKTLSKQIGETLEKLHNQDIIHGDLTTSNMILNQDKIYFIDFGLGFHSNKIEDKAVDIHLLNQALNAKHFTIAEKAVNIILKNYKNSLVLEQLKKVESRGRYKEKY